MKGASGLACLLALSILTVAPQALAQDKKVLVYTRNGLTLAGKPGFVHNNIKASVEALRSMGQDNGFAVDVTDDPAFFTPAKLKPYQVLVFTNTNNEVLDTDEQKAALQGYIRGGGGFVGIHSATGSMRGWAWFCEMIGGRFHRHPRLQPFTIKVVDPDHPSTSFLGETWQWEDEFYFQSNLGTNLRVLLAGDLTTLDDKAKPAMPDNLYPLAWCHEFEGGRVWYTSLGHKPEHYSDANLQKHILGGILWAMGRE
jgi:uncharacterized protein